MIADLVRAVFAHVTAANVGAAGEVAGAAVGGERSHVLGVALAEGRGESAQFVGFTVDRTAVEFGGDLCIHRRNPLESLFINPLRFPFFAGKGGKG